MKKLPQDISHIIKDYMDLWNEPMNKRPNEEKFKKHFDGMIIDGEIKRIKNYIEGIGSVKDEPMTVDDFTKKFIDEEPEEFKIEYNPETKYLELSIPIREPSTYYHICHVVKYFRQFFKIGVRPPDPDYIDSWKKDIEEEDYEDWDYVVYIKVSGKKDLDESFCEFNPHVLYYDPPDVTDLLHNNND